MEEARTRLEQVVEAGPPDARLVALEDALPGSSWPRSSCPRRRSTPSGGTSSRRAVAERAGETIHGAFIHYLRGEVLRYTGAWDEARSAYRA